MKSPILRLAGLVAVLVMAMSLATAGSAEARMGGSFGSRGMRTFSAPSITRIAPNPISPVQRSMTPNTGGYASPAYNNGTNGYQRPFGGGFFSGLGGGIVGGMLGGLLFHGLFGSMMGYGFGGIGGGISSIFQVILVGGLIFFALRLFRGQPAGSGNFGRGFPMNGPSYGSQPQQGYRGGDGAPSPGNGDEIGITNTDLETLERMLAEVQQAFSREDHQGLRRFTTPEMVSYLSEELAENATHGLRNDVTDLKFLNGELAEAWREGSRDYATVAMQWTAIDVMRDRQSGAVVKGDAEKPVEARELWTFVRDNRGPWQLSAIQDAAG